MERAHVLIRLRGGDALDTQQQQQQPRKPDGVTRTSATTVRLEHSDMSPGVASITFEQVFDQQHTSAHIFDQSLAAAVARCVQGFSASLVLAGAPRSGKSFTCHGDRQQSATGVITLALRHVFKELERLRAAEPALECQVLLACFHITARDELVDLLQTPDAAPVSVSPALGTDCTLLQHSVVAATSAEAVHLYTQALARSVATADGSSSSDFALVVHVETKRSSESRVRRGRFACIDINGSSILEPTRWHDGASASHASETAALPPSSKPVFSDTHFPIAAGASRWFGGFVGNASATYMLVTIHKHAQFQQQAIQSLLYACKAKDIKSVCAITYVSALTRTAPVLELHANQPAKVEGEEEQEEADSSLPSSPVSATSSDSTGEFLIASSDDTGFGRLEATRTAAAEPLGQRTKHTLLSQRLRQAYESVKSSGRVPDPLKATPSPPSTRAQGDGANASAAEPTRAKHERFEELFATKTSLLHAKADAMLPDARGELQALSLLDKLERIHAQWQDTVRALTHETTVKAKCVERIAKLSQTMSFQVVEHETQMQQARAETDCVREQLCAMERKFEDVSAEVTQLQQLVGTLKATSSLQPAPAWSASPPSPSPTGSDPRERALLQHLSSRLETAMEEAKAVVDFKDDAIRDLETRLADATARSASDHAHLVLAHEHERARLLREMAELQRQVATSECTTAQAQRECSELHARVMQLTSEVETLTAQLAAREQALAQAQSQVAVADTDRDDAASIISRQQQLEELLAAKTREWIAAHAASAANRRRVELLQVRVTDVVRQMERKKRKMERKAKALAGDCRALRAAAAQHERALAQQVEQAQQREHETQHELARLQLTLQRHESSDTALRAEIEQLERANAALETHSTELQQQLGAARTESHLLASERAAATTACEQQIAAMEQALARRLLEREAQLAAEHERKLRKMMGRHAAELLARDVANDSAHRATVSPHSSSSSHSTLGSSAEFSDAADAACASPHQPSPQPRRQQSIDNLDALIDSKERQYARARDTPRSDRKQPRPESTRQVAELERKLRELTQALAVANEQETLAKAQAQRIADSQHASARERERLLAEMNRLKHENWSLSLALQVTERR